MATCPVCFGDGQFDERCFRAVCEEHLPPHVLAMIPNLDQDYLPCDECEGTGVVSAERLAELEAWARAAVDQVLQAMRNRGQL